MLLQLVRPQAERKYYPFRISTLRELEEHARKVAKNNLRHTQFAFLDDIHPNERLDHTIDLMGEEMAIKVMECFEYWNEEYGFDTVLAHLIKKQNNLISEFDEFAIQKQEKYNASENFLT